MVVGNSGSRGGSGGEGWEVNGRSSEVSRDAEPCNVNILNSCFWKPMCVFLLGFLKSS